jgi:hypothetical protein
LLTAHWAITLFCLLMLQQPVLVELDQQRELERICSRLGNNAAGQQRRVRAASIWRDTMKTSRSELQPHCSPYIERGGTSLCTASLNTYTYTHRAVRIDVLTQRDRAVHTVRWRSDVGFGWRVSVFCQSSTSSTPCRPIARESSYFGIQISQRQLLACLNDRWP